MGQPSLTFTRASYTYPQAERLLVGLGLAPERLKPSHRPGLILAYSHGWGGWTLDGEGLERLAERCGLMTATTAADVLAIEATPPNPLPRFCYVATGFMEREGERAGLAMIFRGEAGARDMGSLPTYKQARDRARYLNSVLAVSPAQATAMEVGAFEGWASKWTDPTRYDAAGLPIRD